MMALVVRTLRYTQGLKKSRRVASQLTLNFWSRYALPAFHMTVAVERQGCYHASWPASSRIVSGSYACISTYVVEGPLILDSEPLQGQRALLRAFVHVYVCVSVYRSLGCAGVNFLFAMEFCCIVQYVCQDQGIILHQALHAVPVCLLRSVETEGRQRAFADMLRNVYSADLFSGHRLPDTLKGSHSLLATIAWTDTTCSEGCTPHSPQCWQLSVQGKPMQLQGKPVSNLIG